MKKILLVLLGVLGVSLAHATVVKITVEMSEKVCVIERFRDNGSLYVRHVMPLNIMAELKDRAQMSGTRLENKSQGQMSVFAIGDTFNVVNDNSPVPFPNWRFMRYFSLNTGGNSVVFASIKICDALDTVSGNWLYYTTGMPIYSTDDTLLTDFGIWSPCIRYAYGVDLYLGTDTAKSPLEIVQVSVCAGIFSPQSEIMNVVVFPNPVSDLLYVPALVGENARIVSSLGSLVYQGVIPSSGVPVGNFSNGLYVLSSEKGTARFIKKE